ncbi:MAG TPA: hypothetical protein VMR52_02220 [Dehalococcoidia bacterium]|nr:hypothetical protein [Dehalococcoidia bacterium]
MAGVLFAALIAVILMSDRDTGFAGISHTVNSTDTTASATPDPSASVEPTPTIPCPAGTATPPGEGCLPCPTAAPLGIQSTCPPLGHVLLWGDDNCSGQADPADALVTLRFDAGLATNTGACPDMGQDVSVQGPGIVPWGDVDCSGGAGPVDALKLLRSDAALGVDQPQSCPDIGANALVNPVN